jgi:pimeloyl-ACP methyl ester carboxylesterase
MSRRARRLLRPLVRRVLPGAPVAPGAAPAGRELLVPGPDGHPIPVADEGQGPAVLLLHSGSADRSSWARVAADLAGRFRVLRFDRWTYRDGHADPAPAGAETMAAEVADVLAVAAAARRGPGNPKGVPRSIGERPLLVGHSSGAVVALESALADPSAFRAMVLYEPPVAVDEPLGGDALRRARTALDAGDPDRAITIHMREIAGAGRPMVAGLRRLPPVWQVIRGHAAAQITDDEAIESLGVGLGRYARLDLPVLLLGGGRSPAHMRARLDALAAVLPRLEEVVILEGQGHMANLRAPGEVARVIAAFADRLGS